MKSKFTLFALVIASYFPAVVAAKTLQVRINSAPVSLDWNGAAKLTEAPLVENLQEGLYAYEYPSQKIVPGAAVSLTKSKDLKEYTFKIRDNAKWSDGRAVFAQDFVDSWMRLLSPQSTSIYIYYLFDIVNAKEFNNKSITAGASVGIKAVDDKTLVVKLKRPMHNWEVNTTFWPLFPIRKDQIEKYGNNWWRAGILKSNGPYLFDSYETGKKIVFKRNPYYHRHQSNLDKIEFQVVVEDDTALKKYETGEFSFLTNLPLVMHDKLSARKDFKPVPVMRMQLFGLNLEKFPMTSKDFRLAILHSIDRKKLIDGNLKVFKPLSTMIPDPLPGSSKPAVIEYDPLKAKEHLKKSGVVLNRNMKIRILTSINEPFFTIGKRIQSQLEKNLGIQIELAALQNQEYSTYMNLGEYNGTVSSWTSKVLSPQDFLLPYSGDAYQNIMHFSNPFFDQWIYAGMAATSDRERSEAFYQAQKVVSIDEAIMIPLFSERQSALINSRIKNLYFNHMGTPILKDAAL